MTPQADPLASLSDALLGIIEAPSTLHGLALTEHLPALVEDLRAHELLNVVNDGASHAEIAEALEISRQAVTKRVAEARRHQRRGHHTFAFAVERGDGSIEIRRHGGGS